MSVGAVSLERRIGSLSTPTDGKHALKRLRRDGKASSYAELIRNIPLDRIDQVEKILTDLQNGT